MRSLARGRTGEKEFHSGLLVERRKSSRADSHSGVFFFSLFYRVITTYLRTTFGANETVRTGAHIKTLVSLFVDSKEYVQGEFSFRIYPEIW